MKTSTPLFAIFLGTFVGVALCFVFYRITGTSMTMFSSASVLRQLADLLCITAFATFGVSVMSRVFARLSK